ncbi:hypothetical protein LTR70_004142 [Exophiala xenobiotica]|uniref:Uncharacterized protein n=1 Tax=Lithohypha guttulata TaxID=1690604 RepID=A0ABR0KEC5_9EURO|nr:hypothetical protein LTR24_003576 [Lithohypha guttulata]KAK5321587.1 hypothetical protein LTR70_004142 [Exophiala xenobiotica]
MVGLNTHSASPLSSKSSQVSLSKTKDNEMTDPSTQAIATASTPEADMMEDVPLVLDDESAPEPLSQPFNNPVVERRPSRTVPRLDTRKSSITAPLPWKVDETSSPYTPTSHARNASFAPPPRAGYRGSIDADLNTDTNTNTNSPMHKLPPLSTTATSGSGSGSSSPYTHAPSSPYTNSSSPLSLTSTHSHTIDLSHPPGYSQHPSTFTDREPATSTSSTLSTPSYTNHTPFYSNSSYTSSIGFSSPLSPMRRGRGILDNDPSIYLSGEEDDESMWDTAAKWAKAAGKRLSVGEQTLWKMVNAMGTGDDRP